MDLKLHNSIEKKLDKFIESEKIPNILFYGPSGSGKKTVLQNFINRIYNDDNEIINKNVMIVNCSHGKGIKFIREELKFFAKTTINCNDNNFKSIILNNADRLTIDAQSALRRCIELFSHNTRFFMIVEDKNKLLKPILSRFCDIFISLPILNSTETNLYQYCVNKNFKTTSYINNRKNFLVKFISNNRPKKTCELFSLTEKLFEKGYSGLDLINYIETMEDDVKKYEKLLFLNKIRKEFRDEKLFMIIILDLLYLRNNPDLENILFM